MIKFNDTTNYNGLTQLFEREISKDRGFISGDTDRMKEFAVDANLALHDYNLIALRASGTWQVGDTNHPDYSILTNPLVSGQRDYPFVTDKNGNLILDVLKVFARISETGVYNELTPVDVASQYTDTFTNGQNLTGIPYQYDKQDNAIFLDPIPNFNSPDGLMMYVSRENSYFDYMDTTKTPGVPVCHEYFYLKPAYEYLRRNGISTTSIEKKIKEVEAKIEQYFGNRQKDVRSIITGKRVFPR